MFVGGLSWETNEGKNGFAWCSMLHAWACIYLSHVTSRLTITCTSLCCREHEKTFRAVWSSGWMRRDERPTTTTRNEEKQVRYLFAARKGIFWLPDVCILCYYARIYMCRGFGFVKFEDPGTVDKVVQHPIHMVDNKTVCLSCDIMWPTLPTCISFVLLIHFRLIQNEHRKNQ